MAYFPTEAWIVPQAIADVSTTQKLPLGTIISATDPTYGAAKFIYCAGGTNVAEGSWVLLNPDSGAVTALAANDKGAVGVAMSAIDATTDYGWVCIYGKVSAKCLTSFADNGRVFCTASVGYVDDTSVAGDRLNIAKGASTSTARRADFEIHYPYVDDATSAGG